MLLATGNLGGIVSIIISEITLYYVYRPHVRSYFGRASSPAPAAENHLGTLYLL